MNKKQALEELKKKIEKDTSLPLKDTATQLVFGEGNPDSTLYFLGEAPGKQEDLLGRPFVGRAGRLLDTLLQGIGLTRQDIYISNVVRFRPPNNRPPTPEEIAAFTPYVNEELQIIHPKLVIPLGRFAMMKFLPDEKISQIHGKVVEITWNGKPLRIFPLFHPAAALRSKTVLTKLQEDMQKLSKLLKKL